MATGERRPPPIRMPQSISSLLNGSGARRAMEGARALTPGLLIAAAVAVVSVLIEAPLARALTSLFGRPLTLPAMVIALLLGIALNRVAAQPMFEAGMSFSVRRLLRIAVALLGIRIALADIYALGLTTAAIVVVSMSVTVVSGVMIGRLFGREDAYGALAGSATAVCGASAALATSTVLPNYRDKNADTVFVVVAVNALSTVAMLLYPPICILLGFDELATGVMLGATIHDVAQVVGAGYAVSDPVGNNAVIVKLFRVFLLLPVVLAVGWYFAPRGGHAEQAKVPVPAFALVFLALVVVNSIGILPSGIRTAMIETSRWGLLIAIGALGLSTSVSDIARAGSRHVAVISAVGIVILVVVTAGLLVTG